MILAIYSPNSLDAETKEIMREQVSAKQEKVAIAKEQLEVDKERNNIERKENESIDKLTEAIINCFKSLEDRGIEVTLRIDPIENGENGALVGTDTALEAFDNTDNLSVPVRQSDDTDEQGEIPDFQP